jgi:hypothetical protein
MDIEALLKYPRDNLLDAFERILGLENVRDSALSG